MARNKYPQETVQRIVETAAELFMKQGYDNTSIQDIIDHLGGLSKGAIYHHFRSKEEILEGVMEHMYRDSEAELLSASNDDTLTGLQKLQKTFECSVCRDSNQHAFAFSINMLDNSRMLAMQVAGVEETAREWVIPLLQQGIEDGSLEDIPYPQAFAEVFLLLSNIWLNPMVYPATPDQIEEKCRFLQHFTCSMGIQENLISEKIIQSLREYTALFQRNTSK